MQLVGSTGGGGAGRQMLPYGLGFFVWGEGIGGNVSESPPPPPPSKHHGAAPASAYFLTKTNNLLTEITEVSKDESTHTIIM